MRDFKLILLLFLCLAQAAYAQAVDKKPVTSWLRSKEVSESSGLARSHIDERLLWTHNDSGDKPRLFAFDTDGRLHAEVEVKKAEAIDWEDMCSFQIDGQPWLAIADVGDNGFARKHVVIYGMKEPKISWIAEKDGGKDAKPAKESTKVDFEIHVTYPSGSLNCEAIAYDPWRKQFILASKEEFRSQVFAVAFDPHAGKQKSHAEWLLTVPAMLVTGATISDDGQYLALGTYGPTCLLRRTTSEPSSTASWQALKDGEPELLPAPPRQQGEAICFDKTGTQLMMTSEGTPMPLIISQVNLHQ